MLQSHATAALVAISLLGACSNSYLVRRADLVAAVGSRSKTLATTSGRHIKRSAIRRMEPSSDPSLVEVRTHDGGRGMAIAGGVLTAIAAVSVIMAAMPGNEPKDDSRFDPDLGSAFLYLSGAVIGAIGVPLLIVGAVHESPEARPRVSAAPGLGVVGSF